MYICVISKYISLQASKAAGNTNRQINYSVLQIISNGDLLVLERCYGELDIFWVGTTSSKSEICFLSIHLLQQ